MFRVNEDLVVDATVTGGPARYINHSCSPNCSAEVVEFEKGGKIIIVTNRRICRGEEVRTSRIDRSLYEEIDTELNFILILFLVACTQLYDLLCRSVGPSVCRSVTLCFFALSIGI